VTRKNIAEVREVANGAIVGTALHRDGDTQAPIDVERVRALVGELNS